MKDIDISILIPARHSTSKFEKTISSLVKTCSRPERIEILVRIDSDDYDGRYLDALKSSGVKFKLICGDRFGGYKTIHLLSQELASLCTGRLIWHYGDDIYMHDCDWFNRIVDTQRIFNDDIYIIYVKRDRKNWWSMEMPIFTRRLNNLFGRVLPTFTPEHPGIACKYLDRCIYLESVTITHDRSRVNGGLPRAKGVVAPPIDTSFIHNHVDLHVRPLLNTKEIL